MFSQKGSHAPRLPDPETKSRTQVLLQQGDEELAAHSQMLLQPLRFRLGDAGYDKLKLFAEEGFPIDMPPTERKRFDALVKGSAAAAAGARTTQLYIPPPFMPGAFNNVAAAAESARRNGRRSIAGARPPSAERPAA